MKQFVGGRVALLVLFISQPRIYFAKIIIQTPILGAVFLSGSVVSLRDALEERISKGPPSMLESQCIRERPLAIAPHSGVKHLLDIIAKISTGLEREVMPPWRLCN